MIDAHQHFWQLGRGDYDWPTKAEAAIFRDFCPDDLMPHLAAAGIAQTILVQATPTVEETRFLLDLAARTPFVAGVVGWVDLTDPGAIATIDALRRDTNLLGLRPMLQSIEDTDWILQPAAEPALRHMAAVGLRFDALIQPRHLGVIARLARRHPDLRIVIDHIAKPRMGPGLRPAPDWLEGISDLASIPNVWCKLSGMVTEIGPDWSPDELTAHAAHVLSAFGPARVMWGSDWPVVDLVADYARWFAEARRLTAGYTAAEQAQIFHGTARDFYGLAA